MIRVRVSKNLEVLNRLIEYVNVRSSFDEGCEDEFIGWNV